MIWRDQEKSNRNYWIHVLLLTIVAVFVPERYSVLIFLGAVWNMLFEISDRLRMHYYCHQRIAEATENIANGRNPLDKEDELRGVL